MAGITLAHAEAQLALWLAADEAVSRNQSYAIDAANGRRELTRANAKEITAKIEYWNNWVLRLSSPSGRGRTRYIVPG